MKILNKIKKTFRKGFTLVELVVVIAIIAILAGVSVAGYVGFTNNAKKQVVNMEGKEVRTNYQAWYITENNNKNDLFTNLDSFRDYLVSNENFKMDPNEKVSINYYVEAQDKDSNYYVNMLYRASNGMISSTELKANSFSLTGEFGDTKTFNNIEDALKKIGINGDGTVVSSDVEITVDALQYGEIGKVKESIYKVFTYDGKSDDVPVTEEIPYLKEITDEIALDLVMNTSAAQGSYNDAKLNELTEFTYDTVYNAFVEYYIAASGASKEEIIQLFGIIIEQITNQFLTELEEAKSSKVVAFRYGEKVMFTNPYETEMLLLKTSDSNPVTIEKMPGDVELMNSSSSSAGALLSVHNFKSYNINSVYLKYGTKDVQSNITPTFDECFDKAIKDGLSLVVDPTFGKTNSIVLNSNITSNSSLILGVKDDSIKANEYFIKEDSNGNIVSPNYSKDKATTPVYKVTLGESIEVSGELQIGGQRVGVSQPYSGYTAEYVELEIPEGKTLTIKSGGSLSSYGKITGKGKVIVEEGGEVLEPMEIFDFRGGANATYTLISEKVIPFNKYVPENIQAELVLEKGSKYTLEAMALNTSISVEFIGSNGIFNVNSGKVMKRFTEDGKMQIIIDGEVVDSKLVLNALGRQINLTDSAFPLYKTDIIVNSGKVELSKLKLKVLPGSSIDIKKGASVVINADSQIGVYSSADFNFYNSIGASLNSSFDGFSDATCNVAGSLIIKGALGGKVTTSNDGSVVFEAQAQFKTDFKEAYQLGMGATPVNGSISLTANVNGIDITSSGTY